MNPWPVKLSQSVAASSCSGKQSKTINCWNITHRQDLLRGKKSLHIIYKECMTKS